MELMAISIFLIHLAQVPILMIKMDTLDNMLRFSTGKSEDHNKAIVILEK